MEQESASKVVNQYILVISMLEKLASALAGSATSGQVTIVTPASKGSEEVEATTETIKQGGLKDAIKGVTDVYYSGMLVSTTFYLGYIVVPENRIEKIRLLVEQVNKEKQTLQDMHKIHLKEFKTTGRAIAREVQERLMSIDMTKADESEKLLYGQAPIPRITQATRLIKLVDSQIEKMTIYPKVHRRVEKLSMEKALEMIEALNDEDMEIARRMLSGATPSKLRFIYQADSYSYIANIKLADTVGWRSTPANTPIITTHNIHEFKCQTGATGRMQRKDRKDYIPLVEGLGIYEQE